MQITQYWTSKTVLFHFNAFSSRAKNERYIYIRVLFEKFKFQYLKQLLDKSWRKKINLTFCTRACSPGPAIDWSPKPPGTLNPWPCVWETMANRKAKAKTPSPFIVPWYCSVVNREGWNEFHSHQASFLLPTSSNWSNQVCSTGNKHINCYINQSGKYN